MPLKGVKAKRMDPLSAQGMTAARGRGRAAIFSPDGSKEESGAELHRRDGDEPRSARG